MSILPDKAPPGVDDALYARVKEATLSWGDFLGRLGAWRCSEGWEDVPEPTRLGVLAVIEHAHATIRGVSVVAAHDKDPTRRQIEVSYLNRIRDHAYLLYDLGLDAWEKATGSREIPASVAPPAPVPPTPKPVQPANPSQAANPTRPRHKSGIVYLLRSDMGHHKIGQTRNLKHRQAMFGVTLPFGFDIIHTIQCADRLAAEQQLHARFADRRNNGEWFDLTDEDVAYITSLTEL